MSCFFFYTLTRVNFSKYLHCIGMEENKTPVIENLSLSTELDQIKIKKQELQIAEMITIDKALHSDDPSAIIKAMEIVKIQTNQTHDNRKSVIVDPFSFDNSFGYKNKPTHMSYDMLHRMSRTPIILSILNTRKDQIAAFGQPQEDRYGTGFIITKKEGFYSKEKTKLTRADYKVMDYITEFILNCGANNSWSRCDFDQFLRMSIEDSLTYDQLNFEVVRDLGGRPFEFVPTDPGTIRIADSWDDENYDGERKMIGGYYPSYVQVVNEKTVAEFYPWELGFGIRNPSSKLNRNGYGRSELEDMVNIVTSLLWSEEYNRNFFKQGSSPKGILKMKPNAGGGIDGHKLEEFKQAWRSMIAGVQNAWKTPILEADMEWIDLQKSNRDMEFGKWNEFLIKLACALYTIDPSEIGFAAGSGESAPMFEKSNSQNLKYSKDKGLKPKLKFLEAQLNRMIVSQIHPDFCLRFVGLDAESESERRERQKDEVQWKKTLNEVRAEDDLQPLPNGDILLNATYTGYLNMQQMQQQQEEAGGFDEEGGGNDEEQEESYDENPFEKAFNDFIITLSK